VSLVHQRLLSGRSPSLRGAMLGLHALTLAAYAPNNAAPGARAGGGPSGGLSLGGGSGDGFSLDGSRQISATQPISSGDGGEV
jgi:hypothetical protein